jgi:curved DNA-binding protein
MIFTDYYRVMGIAPQATPDEIKTAYRKLARTYHPDVNQEPGTVKRFTDIGEANEVLEDPVRRAAYDKLRADGWQDGQEMHAQPPPQGRERSDGSAPGEDAQFSDFFQSMFGGRTSGARRRGSPRSDYQERGGDLHYTIAVTLEESFHGSKRQLTLQSPAIDEHGALAASSRTLTVTIPKGVLQGTQIRLRGQGHPGSNADLNGDLYLEVNLVKHALYRCAGGDVLLDVPIAPWEAVLGAKIDVPTLDGIVTATIPSGAQQGQRLRLKGRGLPHDPPGDQYLTLQIVVPPTASDQVMDIYRTLAKASAFDPRSQLRSQP